MKRSIYVLLMVVAFVFLFTACTSNETDDNENSSSEIVEDVNSDIEKNEENYGIAFLGYDDYYINFPIENYLNANQLNNIEKVGQEGDEYYLIVPKEDCYVEVYYYDVENPEFQKENIIHTPQINTTILLKANVSDLYPNTKVVIRDKNGDILSEFIPIVDLKTGNAVIESGGYELSKNIDFDNSEMVEYKTDEILFNLPKLWIDNVEIASHEDEYIFTYVNTANEDENEWLLTIGLTDDVYSNYVYAEILSGITTQEKEQLFLVADYPIYISEEMNNEENIQEYRDLYNSIQKVLVLLEMTEGYEFNDVVYKVDPYKVLEIQLGDFLEGKTILENDPDYVNGKLCTMVSIGVSTAEKFTAENHYAISESGDLYEYDVVADKWISVNNVG